MIENDPELSAMSHTFEALRPLTRSQASRVIRWARDRFGIEEGVKYPESAPAVVVEQVEVKEDIKEDMKETAPKRRRGRAKKIKETETKEATPPGSISQNQKELTDYETIDDLFKDVDAKKLSAKILLIAAYLQEKSNLKEITSYDINFRLKRIGFGVQNISSAINGVLKRIPPVMIELVKKDDPVYARKKYKVTPEGIKVAKSFLKGVAQ